MPNLSGLTLPIPAELILPHRPPMLLLERLLACVELTAEAEACFPAHSLFAAADGRLDPVVMVELMAQTYAALRGYDDLVHGRPVKEGLLVGARQVRILAPARVGAILRIAMRTEGAFEGFALVEGEVRCGEELLAAGTIKLWVQDRVRHAGEASRFNDQGSRRGGMRYTGTMSRLAEAIRMAALGPPVLAEGEAAVHHFLDEGFPAFEGHFPGYALLPAVVQVLAAATLIEDWRGRTLSLASVEKAKFLMQLHPGRTVTVRCRERVIAGRRRYEASLGVEEGLAASFTLGFAEDAV